MLSKNKKTILKSVALVGAVTTTGAVATTTTGHADTNENAQTQAQQSPVASQLSNLKQSQTQAENTLAQQNQTKYAAESAKIQPQIDQLQTQLKKQQANQATSDQQAIQKEQAKLQNIANAKTEQENTSYNKAVNAENTQYASQVANQEASNQKVLADAQAKIYTQKQKDEMTYSAKKNYGQKQSNLDEQHQNKLKELTTDYNKQSKEVSHQIQQKKTEDKERYDQKVKKATDTVDQQIAEAKATRNNANVQVNMAQKKLNEDQAKSFNAATFFKSIINNSNVSQDEQEDARIAYNIVTGNSKSVSVPSWYKKVVHLGRDDDASSLENMQAALPMYKDFIRFRKDNGLSIPKVSLVQVAIAIVDADYQLPNGGLEHPGYYPTAENLAEGYTPNTAVDGWVNEERERWNAETKKNPELAKHVNNGYWVYQNYPDIYQETGHYLNFMMYQPAAYGFAHVSDIDAYDGDSSSIGYYTIDEYAKLLNDYSASHNFKKIIATDQDNLKKARESLKTANNKLSQLNDNRDVMIQKLVGPFIESSEIQNLKNNLIKIKTTYDNAVKEENKHYQHQSVEVKTSYQQEIEHIKSLPTNVDQLKAQLQRKIDLLRQHHEVKINQLAKDHQNKLDAIKADTDKQLDAFKQQLAAKNTKESQPLIDQITKLQRQLTKEKNAYDQQLSDLKAKDDAEYKLLQARIETKQTTASVVKGNVDHYTNRSGQVINLEPAKNVSSTSIANLSHSAQKEVTQELPQTGNTNSSIMLVALGILCSMFGFSLANRKRY